MNLAYVDYYQKGESHHKDPVTIPNALFDLGHNITLISCDPCFDGVSYRIDQLPVLSLESVEKSGWNSFGFSAVIFVSRLDTRFTQTVQNICKSGLRLIIKADTDGTWGYPLVPNYLRARTIKQNPINLLRHIKWKIPSSYLVAQKIRQIQLADAIVVESPNAAVNAVNIFLHWSMDNLVKKVKFIPNPISRAALALPVSKHRDDLILTIGRWEDRGVKNTQIMLQVIETFLRQNQNYNFEIIGSGLQPDEASKYLRKFIESGRVKIKSELPYIKLQECLGRAKIVLIPSVMESFCLVAAEALCAGASLAVTPIESLSYFAGGGRWGSIAKGFAKEQILAALTYEVQAWEQGLRNSMDLSTYWRKELNPHKIALQFSNLTPP